MLTREQNVGFLAPPFAFLGLNLDNFKAAFRNADWFDPDINPKLADFCRHYGMYVLPCRPGRPDPAVEIVEEIRALRTTKPECWLRRHP